ncbi:hypothetical protein [Streptomyces qinzhouensis]|uniref:Uncharacterized protein n=1 Tax=Streptomyces qinzhouensis TaxID=2599401 RepID=A0A5B8IGK5_9ACTN|nr:hypothetical protein [Streptomyces qinzhouensis]QDY77322.1 hypothetical protein FQU76_13235 [Streptomyces qinzhouensis]
MLLVMGPAGCTSTEAERNGLDGAGWKKESVLSGAEATLGQVSPAACRPLVEILDRRTPDDEVTGFRHEQRGSYLLIREFTGTVGLPRRVLDAARACPAMTMGYDSTTLTYTVTVVAQDKRETRLLLAAQESGTPLTEMLVSAAERDGRQSLIRVMRPEGIGDVERAGADLAVSTG